MKREGRGGESDKLDSSKSSGWTTISVFVCSVSHPIFCWVGSISLKFGKKNTVKCYNDITMSWWPGRSPASQERKRKAGQNPADRHGDY
jgi:hypothetical protein